MTTRKGTFLFLLSSITLLLSLSLTGPKSARAIDQQMPTKARLSLVLPIITPAGSNNKGLDAHGCFWATIHGSYFTASARADLYAVDDANDSLTITPWSINIANNGTFTRSVHVCGVSSSVNAVTFTAVDNATGASSNPLTFGINQA